jgi:hypothetical protein
MPDRKRVLWLVISGVCGLFAAAATRTAATAVWHATTNGEPPQDPGDRDTSWPAALIWAVALGVGAGVTRLVATRLASTAWELAADEPPPGVRSD